MIVEEKNLSVNLPSGLQRTCIATSAISTVNLSLFILNSSHVLSLFVMTTRNLLDTTVLFVSGYMCVSVDI